MSDFPLRRSLSFGSVLILATLLPTATAFAAVSPQQMDAIQGRSVLSEDDKQTLADFVVEQLNTMLIARNGQQLAKASSDLLARKDSKAGATAVQDYSDVFAQTVKGNYQRTYDQAASAAEKSLISPIRLGLAIILARTDNPLLIEDLLGLLQNESHSIRYWGAGGLAMPRVAGALGAEAPGSQRLESVRTGLTNCLNQESHPTVIAQVATAATAGGAANPEAAADILRQCIARRLPLYQDWSIENELSDQVIIDNVYRLIVNSRLATNGAAQKELVTSVGILYAAAFSRYRQGMDQRDGEEVLALLDIQCQHELQTLLILSELLLRKICASIDANVPARPRFPNAIEGGKWPEIDRAYEQLLGERGAVNATYKIFSVGTPSPFSPVPNPPAELIARAKIRVDLLKNTLQTSED